MLRECVNWLNLRHNGIYLDGTAGLGGHSEEIAKSGARLICLDKDTEAVNACSKRLEPYGDRVSIVKSDFRDMDTALDTLSIGKLDGVLLDLGVSSLQLDKPERGFSYRFDAPLDMRMDNNTVLTADEIVNTWDFKALCDILRDYGEERYAIAIVNGIIRSRPINTTAELREVIARFMPGKGKREAQHPARRTFQALRISVNDELGAAREGIHSAIKRLSKGGRLCVITFHSLEDKLAKRIMAEYAQGCTCPPSFPVCVCGKQPEVRVYKSVKPSDGEIAANPRSQSARLRICEKL